MPYIVGVSYTYPQELRGLVHILRCYALGVDQEPLRAEQLVGAVLSLAGLKDAAIRDLAGVGSRDEAKKKGGCAVWSRFQVVGVGVKSGSASTWGNLVRLRRVFPSALLWVSPFDGLGGWQGMTSARFPPRELHER